MRSWLRQINRWFPFFHLGLSLGQWCVLKHLIDMPGTSANALAAAVGVHPSTYKQAEGLSEMHQALSALRDRLQSHVASI